MTIQNQLFTADSEKTADSARINYNINTYM